MEMLPPNAYEVVVRNKNPEMTQIYGGQGTQPGRYLAVAIERSTTDTYGGFVVTVIMPDGLGDIHLTHERYGRDGSSREHIAHLEVIKLD